LTQIENTQKKNGKRRGATSVRRLVICGRVKKSEIPARKKKGKVGTRAG